MITNQTNKLTYNYYYHHQSLFHFVGIHYILSIIEYLNNKLVNEIRGIFLFLILFKQGLIILLLITIATKTVDKYIHK